MSPRRAAWYEAKIAFGLSAVLPLLLLPVVALLHWLFWQRAFDPPRVTQVVRALELVLPLVVGLAVAHLMGVEREAGFAELRRSYPEHRWRMPLLRTAGALGLGVVAVLLGLVAFRLAFGAFNLFDVVRPSLAPALFLLGLSLLLGNLTGSYWAAAGVALGYWFIEFVTQGTLTKGFFLFQASFPVDDVDYDTNRALLYAAGAALLALNAWWGARR